DRAYQQGEQRDEPRTPKHDPPPRLWTSQLGHFPSDPGRPAATRVKTGEPQQDGSDRGDRTIRGRDATPRPHEANREACGGLGTGGTHRWRSPPDEQVKKCGGAEIVGGGT